MSKVARKGPAKGKKAEPVGRRPAAPPAPEEAVAEFTSAVKAFQKNDFPKAAEQLGRILRDHPDEREICDRARTYLAACERHIHAPSPQLENAEDHYNWGVVQLNRGETDEARQSFETALSLAPRNDKARFALACAQAREGRTEEAIAALRQAIADNPGNRLLARTDPDMESLRSHPVFQDLVRGSGGREG